MNAIDGRWRHWFIVGGLCLSLAHSGPLSAESTELEVAYRLQQAMHEIDACGDLLEHTDTHCLDRALELVQETEALCLRDHDCKSDPYNLTSIRMMLGDLHGARGFLRLQNQDMRGATLDGSMAVQVDPQSLSPGALFWASIMYLANGHPELAEQGLGRLRELGGEAYARALEQSIRSQQDRP